MKIITLLALLMYMTSAQVDHLCFSPVKEKKGDKNTNRSFWQAFNYKVQVDNGPIVVPSEAKSTKYEFTNNTHLVKIYLGEKYLNPFMSNRSC
jgi:hypothetical protein